jgi:uncharacterized protein (TIGR00255 family)
MSGIVRSMTGFARVRRAVSNGEIVLTIRSLNHRGLDIHFHAGPEMDALEGQMRALVKQKVLRGHVELRAGFHRAGTQGAPAVNEALLETWLDAFRTASTRYSLTAEPDLNMAFRIPGIFGDALDGDPSPEFAGAALAATEEALDSLNAFRAREGSDLALVLKLHNTRVRQAALQMGEIRSQAMPLFHTKVSERVRDLLRGSAIDPQRLAQEAALLADRSDIGEEVARLTIHSEQLEKLLEAGGEIGKKLDFLLQEMNRETNTILSKTSGVGDLGLKITDLALGAKSEIEKIREQALNLE